MAAAAAGGFALGTFLRGGDVKPDQREAVPGASAALEAKSSASEPESEAPAVIAADFDDADGFRFAVDALAAEGLSERHAQWLTLREKSSDNISASFNAAQGAGLIDLWAAGAAEVDPRGAMTLLLGLPIKEGKQGLVTLFETVGRIDPRLGLELLADLPPGSGYEPIFALVQSWAKVAPFREVAAAVRSLPATPRRTAMFGLLKSWGKADRRGMLTWVQSQPDLSPKLGFQSLFEFPGMQNPEEILELATEFPDAADWMTLAQTVGQLGSQGAGGVEAIAQLPPGLVRDDMLGRFAATLAGRQPDAAWALMETLDAGDRTRFFRGAAHSLARSQPERLAEKLGTEDFPEIADTLVLGWSDKDPRQALDWARRNLSGTARDESMDVVFSSWSKKDPRTAVAAIADLPPGQRARLLPIVATAYGQSDPPAALAWAESLPPIDRTRGVTAVMEGWGANDPVAAATAIRDLPPDDLSDAFESVAFHVARKDPEFAAGWAAGLADGDTRNRTIREVVSMWSRQDAASASEYLGELEAGTFRDQAVVGFVGSVRELDPAAAAAWAKSVGDADIRKSSLRSALSAWKANDPASARRFAESLEPGPLRDEMFKVTAP